MFTQLSEYDFLPPSNEVWGKVMFSQVFICPRGGGCLQSGGWGSASRGRGDLHRGVGILKN